MNDTDELIFPDSYELVIKNEIDKIASTMTYSYSVFVGSVSYLLAHEVLGRLIRLDEPVLDVFTFLVSRPSNTIDTSYFTETIDLYRNLWKLMTKLYKVELYESTDYNNTLSKVEELVTRMTEVFTEERLQYEDCSNKTYLEKVKSAVGQHLEFLRRCIITAASIGNRREVNIGTESVRQLISIEADITNVVMRIDKSELNMSQEWTFDDLLDDILSDLTRLGSVWTLRENSAILDQASNKRYVLLKFVDPEDGVDRIMDRIFRDVANHYNTDDVNESQRIADEWD